MDSGISLCQATFTLEVQINQSIVRDTTATNLARTTVLWMTLIIGRH